MMTMGIAADGYRVAYEPKAIASETASANVEEETKRKVRISAGGIQSIIRLRGILGPLSHPKLFFQYFSHRVLRWDAYAHCDARSNDYCRSALGSLLALSSHLFGASCLLPHSHLGSYTSKQEDRHQGLLHPLLLRIYARLCG